MFNATFNNISAISWRSGGNRRIENITDLVHVTDNLDHILLNWVHLTIRGIRTHNVSGSRRPLWKIYLPDSWLDISLHFIISMAAFIDS